jgi:hypothetical protein
VKEVKKVKEEKKVEEKKIEEKEEDGDSADDELEKLYGRNNNKK